MSSGLKKEFVSMLSAMIMEILSDDEEDDILPTVAIQEIISYISVNESKPKEKANNCGFAERRVIKETRYLQKTRFEKYEKPIADPILSCDMCLVTLKRKNECFCPEHIDRKKLREVSLVVVQKGEGAGLNNSDFRSFWNMSRTTVEIVYSLVNPPGTEADVAPIELLTVLWHIATNEPIEQLESRFSMPKAKILQLESTVFERLCCLRPCLEKWPAGDTVSMVVAGFKCLGGLGAIGAVGNVHFTCKKAPFNPKHFVNSLGHSSAIFQLVTDHRGVFTGNSYFFWPGSNSPLADSTTLKTLPVPENTFLVGNLEHINSKRIIVPYWGKKLSQQQQEFNNRHSHCMKVLESAVLLLVSRFKILTSLSMTHPDYVRQLVASCVLLHNLCIDLNDSIPIDASLETVTFFPPARPVPPSKREVEFPLSNKRDELCARMAATEDPDGRNNQKRRKYDTETNASKVSRPRDIPHTKVTDNIEI